MKHLILIGLPGSGKTTVGRLLAERLGWPFADSDAALCERLKSNIPAIFAQKGEVYFRAQERQTLQELCALSPRVIATGGGAVLSQENRDLLRASGLVIFLDRAPQEIAVSAAGRPLLQRHSVQELSHQRRAWYRACAHVSVRAQSAEEAAARIARHIKEDT